MPTSPALRVLALLLVALAAPASAQARFVGACTASAAGQDLDGLDPQAICGCAAERTLGRGVLPADLDALVDEAAGGGELDMDAVSEGKQALASIVTESMLGCVFEAGLASLGGDLQGALAGDLTTTEPDPAHGAPATPMPTATPALPSGLRTGNGAGATRTEQAGPGAAIRILG